MSARLLGVVTRRTSPPAGDSGDRKDGARPPLAVVVRSADTRTGLAVPWPSKGDAEGLRPGAASGGKHTPQTRTRLGEAITVGH